MTEVIDLLLLSCCKGALKSLMMYIKEVHHVVLTEFVLVEGERDKENTSVTRQHIEES